MCIEINKHLFASYCGLVSSGYALTDLSDPEIKLLYEQIRGMDVPASTRAYFAQARTDQIAVNPYYPRGSDISAACFFLGKPAAEFLQFIKSCASPSAQDPAFAGWIAQLGSAIEQIEPLPPFEGLWQTYRALAEKRNADAGRQVRGTQELLVQHGFATGVRLVFAPNLLQSPYLADFAFTDATLYLIATRYSETAALHEYLHTFFTHQGDLLTAILRRDGIERYVDVPKMLQIGYMQDRSTASQCHALEDCFIRGLVGSLASERIALPDYVQMNVNMGFSAVPRLIAFGRQHPPQASDMDNFIWQALDGAPEYPTGN
jgi:hypothetical protein